MVLSFCIADWRLRIHQLLKVRDFVFTKSLKVFIAFSSLSFLPFSTGKTNQTLWLESNFGSLRVFFFGLIETRSLFFRFDPNWLCIFIDYCKYFCFCLFGSWSGSNLNRFAIITGLVLPSWYRFLHCHYYYLCTIIIIFSISIICLFSCFFF